MKDKQADKIKTSSTSKTVKNETKKAYSKPQLVDHGSVLELTQTGGSRTADFFGGQQP